MHLLQMRHWSACKGVRGQTWIICNKKDSSWSTLSKKFVGFLWCLISIQKIIDYHWSEFHIQAFSSIKINVSIICSILSISFHQSGIWPKFTMSPFHLACVTITFEGVLAQKTFVCWPFNVHKIIDTFNRSLTPSSGSFYTI